MPRTDGQRAVIRFCLVSLGCLAGLFGWVALLTFDLADPPAFSVWPRNDPPANWCGLVGAQFAYAALYWFGTGAYAALFLLTAGLIAWSRGIGFRDFGLRVVGAALITAVFSTLGALFITAGAGRLMSGPGGVVGTTLAAFLVERLQIVGTLIALASSLVVGIILAADDLIVFLFGGIRWAGRYSGPALQRGGSAVAQVSATVAGVGAVMAQTLTTLRRGEPAGGLLPSRPNAAGSPRGASGRNPDEARSVPARATRNGLTEATAGPARNGKPAAQADTSAVSGRARPPADRQADEEDERHPEDSDLRADECTDELSEPDLEAPPLPDGARGASVRPIPRWSGGAAASRKPGLFDTEGGEGRGAAAPRPPAPLFAPAPDAQPYVLPPLEALDAALPINKSAIEVRCREQAFILEQTLNEFRVEVQVVAIDTGPVVTVFELKLSPGIKVSQIASLTNDMARALKAPSVRVVAPLPGKNTIGIEVPNLDKEKVRLRDIIENSSSRAADYALPLYLGKDASGAPLVSDLTRMPHLLIAGTTGSGKSVCVTSIIMSILLTRTPAEVQMILVDPKVVELAMYKDVPHLMCPIITEMSKAEGILDWAATKMDERYALLAEAGVKDIRSYNRLGPAGLKERLQIDTDEELARIPLTLPYIVIVIDELADMMMTSAKEVEFYLCRLAQKSRAVGIHLIVSTQRPQANVVTGLIKSNLPCRIAFRVASRLDSRIVLDQNGGEILMGQGDMLFLPPGQSKLVRAQGTFISDEELRSVVKHCKEQRQPQFHPELVKLPGAGAATAGERDELFDQAVDAVLETGRGSVSLLQRRLTIGYGRAARLIEQMYEAGLVGEYKGSQAREVLVSKEEWSAIRSQRDREEAEEERETPRMS